MTSAAGIVRAGRATPSSALTKSGTPGEFNEIGARVPRLPVELSEARRASGNLGGRPRKPTQAEARSAALEQMTSAERGVIMQRWLEQHPRLIELPERLRGAG